MLSVTLVPREKNNAMSHGRKKWGILKIVLSLIATDRESYFTLDVPARCTIGRTAAVKLKKLYQLFSRGFIVLPIDVPSSKFHFAMKIVVIRCVSSQVDRQVLGRNMQILHRIARKGSPSLTLKNKSFRESVAEGCSLGVNFSTAGRDNV